MIRFQRERSLALSVWPQQSRRFMSNDDASRQKGLKETTKSALAQGILIPGKNMVSNSINTHNYFFICSMR